MKFLLLMTLTLSQLSFAKGVSLGIVNFQKILENTKEGKRINAKLKKSFTSKEKKLKSKEAKLKAESESYAKSRAMLNPKAQAKKDMELQGKIRNFQQEMVASQKEISTMEAKLKKPLLEKIKKIVDKISNSEAVDFTIEVSASPVVYAKSKVDLTDKVIKAYDKAHK